MSQLWHSEEDMPYRRTILLEIYKLFQRSSEVSHSPDWKQSFPSFVRRLELVLYLCGSSLEEYSDPTTVVKRLRSVAEHLHKQRVQQQQQLAQIERGGNFSPQVRTQDSVSPNQPYHIQLQAPVWTGDANVPLQQYIIRHLGAGIPGLNPDTEGGARRLVQGSSTPGYHPETIILKQEDLVDNLGRAVPQGFLQQQSPQLDQLFVQNASGQLVPLSSLGEGSSGSHLGQDLPQDLMQPVSLGCSTPQTGLYQSQEDVPSLILPADQVSLLRGEGAGNEQPPRIVVEGEQGARYYLDSSQVTMALQVAPPDPPQDASAPLPSSWARTEPMSEGSPLVLNDTLMPALSADELQPALSPEYLELVRAWGARGGGNENP
ncbi:hypothetical protein BSKO_00250 [Bryopsis sp. KO-2023]|nr:hypothetical protein BSKO_00250 [Bryopsis sp. KO-2023]